MTATVTTQKLARLIGCPEVTVRSWRRKGWIAPAESTKPGTQGLYDASTALAVILMGLARRRGLGMKCAHAVYHAFLCRSIDDIRADIKNGRTHLVVVGGSHLPLCRLQDVASNRRAFELAERLNMPYVVIDVAAAVEKLEAALEEIDKQPGKMPRELDTYPVGAYA